jgi:hypothetical protein
MMKWWYLMWGNLCIFPKIYWLPRAPVSVLDMFTIFTLQTVLHEAYIGYLSEKAGTQL